MRRRMMTLPHVRIGGFALVTAPAEYAVTGVKTFTVSHDGWFTKKIIQRTSSGLQGLGVIRSSTGYPTSSLERNTCDPCGLEQRGATTDRVTLISRGIDPPLRWR